MSFVSELMVKVPAPVRPVEIHVPLPSSSYSMSLILEPLVTTETVTSNAPSPLPILIEPVAAGGNAGVTEPDAVEVAPVPTALTALTRNV